MKKILSLLISAGLAVSSLSFVSYASDYNTDIPIGQSGQAVQMIGSVKPTIMSVTMPTTVPFDISKSVNAANKVISPRIKIKNNSNVPVTVTIGDAKVDVTRLQGTTWSDNGEQITDSQIAIGLKNEEIVDTRPQEITGATWIKNGENNSEVMKIEATGEGYTYVVGAIGNNVPEDNGSTFSVVPIFIVTQSKG